MPLSQHEEKMVNLQHQLRHNQSDFHDYLADLDNWEADIKKKEGQLKSGLEQQTQEGSDLPPVRNTIHKKKLKKRKKEKHVVSNKTKKIDGFDFKAWDNFDVDKALDEIDKESDKRDTSSSEYETDEEWELERKKHLAGIEKDKGNKFLKTGEFDQAVEAYTKGIGFDATNAILPANRAMALLKQQKFAAAELDCTTSITLDPLYVKAYLRRATARSGIGKLTEAVSDFNRVLDLEPSNKQAKTEIERLQKELQRDEETPVATTLTEDECGRVKPIYKPPEERSKKPLIRIPIEEIGLEASVRPTPSAKQSDLVKEIVEKEKKEFDHLFTSPLPAQTTLKNDCDKPVSVSKPVIKDSTSCEKMTKSDVKLINTSVESTKTRVKTDGIECHKEKKTESQDERREPPSAKVTNVTQAEVSKARTSSVESSTASQSNGHLDNNGAGFGVPQTSFQFQSDFKVLKNLSESFFQYFQAIPPSHYSKLFGQCLDAEILVTVLKTVGNFSDRADVFAILNSLTVVKRFSMTAMFLSQKDKKVVRDLIEGLEKSGKYSEQDLSTLDKKYDL